MRGFFLPQGRKVLQRIFFYRKDAKEQSFAEGFFSQQRQRLIQGRTG